MKQKLLLLIIFSLFSCNLLLAQTLNWVAKFGDVDIDNASDVAVDTNGNVYAVGFFKGVVDFDPGPNYNPINFSSDATNRGNIYCVKLTPNGNLVWAKQIGGVLWTATSSVENTFIPKVELDGNNNVYISGVYDYRVDFDPSSAGSYYIPNPEMQASTFSFISKYDSSGNFIWAKRTGSNNDSANSSISDMKVDNNGNIYLTGVFNTTVDFDPGPNTFNLVSDINYDIYYLKLDTNGNFQWAKSIGIAGNNETVNGLTIDNQSLYLTGSYRGLVDFDPSNSTLNLQSSGNSEDIFIAKYNLSDGNLQWAKSFGSPSGWDKGIAVSADDSGNIYATGFFRQSVDFDPNPNTTHTITSFGNLNIYVLKLNNMGEFVWVKNFASSKDGFHYTTTPTDITVKGDQLFVTGTYLVQMVNGSGQPIISTPSNPFHDIFVLGLSSNDGNLNWSKGFGGTKEDISTRISLQNNNDLLLVGAFKDSVDFNPNSGTVITASSNYDAFVLKLNFNNLLETSEVNFIKGLKIHPNPTSDFIQLESKEKISNVSVYNSEGRLMITKDFDKNNITLELHHLTEGVYFLNMTINSKKYVKKIIKK